MTGTADSTSLSAQRENSAATAKVAAADLIHRLYAEHPEARRILLDHSRKVTRRALRIGRFLQSRGEPVDLQFLAEAAMLHDIGILGTHAPDLGCNGPDPYLRHGIIGRKILEDAGLPRHARVCERHIGVGLTARDIESQGLPLPVRDMQPETLEEQIICYADLFYSKNLKKRDREKPAEEIARKLRKYDASKVKLFSAWQKRFEPERA